MARVSRKARRNETRLDTPKGLRSGTPQFENRDGFARFTEAIARGMGTPTFLFGLVGFVIVWMLYTAFNPFAASATARFAVTVDLPTPPLPLVIA